MKELLTTKGRISRSTYWIFLIFLNALLFVDFLSKSESVPEVTDPLGLLIWFPVLIVGIIVHIKRWTDVPVDRYPNSLGRQAGNESILAVPMLRNTDVVGVIAFKLTELLPGVVERRRSARAMGIRR